MPVPEQGQLVEVRRRQFVVADVERSALPRNGRALQHLVSLNSIEDDALGESLQVIWEIEPGARVLERAGLPKPDGFDDPGRLEAFLYAVRWGAVTDADYQAIQSPFRSGIAIEDYQLDPVVRAIQMPRANLLIADDVGLGKTIEAGLVIQELILRHRARTVLIVCPASLQIKWREEMREKFGLEFRIVDTALLRELRRSRGIHVNPWTHFPRLITSIDWLKRDIPMRMLREVLPTHATYPRPFDILVVDEAHNIAPTGSANYVLDSQRTRSIRALAPHFEHRLFLTATPHNGYPVSFTSLLELLDDQRFARGVPPDRDQLATVMVRRMKDDIVDWKGQPKFARRRIVPIEVRYTEDERRIHRLLADYARLRLAVGDDAHRYGTEFVLKLLKKRLFSSPAAFAQTLEKHRQSLQRGRMQPKRRPNEVRILRRAIAETDEEYADDERLEASLDEAVEFAGDLTTSLSARERELLDEMTRWADRARSRPDSKAEALLEWLEEHVRPGGQWTNDRVIVFTEYRATQNYVIEVLTSRGFGDRDRLMTIYGGMDEEQRERVKAAFQASPSESSVRLLVATDAASEGIDLQNHCNLMIHTEIPWNPNRLEQRNGRIDRHGQRRSEVLIHHFVGAGYRELSDEADIATGSELEADLEFLMLAVRKVERIREDLGRVGSVIADQVQAAMLGRRGRLDTRSAEEQASAARRVLAVERRIQDQIARLHERLLDSRQRLELTPQSVKRVVEVGLALAGQPPLEPARLAGVDEDTELVFRMPALSGSWGACTVGLAHPHTGKRRPITFDHRLAEGRDDVVLVHLEHRLVQMCLRLLRAEIWAPDNAKRLHRVTAGIVDDNILEAPAVVAHARLVVTGDDRNRLHEEIVRAGGVIRHGRFARLNVGEIDNALGRMRNELPPRKLIAELADLWPRIEPSLVLSLDARRDERMQYVANALDRRRDKEIADIGQILGELRRSVEAELEHEFGPRQLEVWTDLEREQLRRNLGRLQARIDAIPEEIERETEIIHRRYTNPQPRLFPVAVTYLVPESLSR